MFTVAIIGSDGAGKTTICRRITNSLPLPAKYVYMGINLDTSNLMLPTTRLLLELRRACGKRPDMKGPPDPTRTKPAPKGIVRRAMAGLKSYLRLVNLLGEEWFRQVVVWYHQRRGRIVLFDRHFFLDYYAHDVDPGDQRLPLHRRIHGFFLRYLYPRPDLVIHLDAPAEFLFQRKGEGTLELLNRRSDEYRRLRDVLDHFHTVDATQSVESVAREVTELIGLFLESTHHHAPEYLGDHAT